MGKPMRQVLEDISRAYKSVEDCMDECRERSLVLTKLDEARLWAIEYCVVNPKKEDGTVYCVADPKKETNNVR